MRRLATGLAVVCALGATAAADGLDAERFVPAVGAEGGFRNEHPAVPFHLGWSMGLFLNGADDQVVERDANDVVISKPVDTGLTANLLFAIGLFGRAEIGVDLPIHFIWEGDPFGANNATGGVGDLRFVPKVAIIRSGTLERHFLLGFALPITAPTGNEDAFRGAGGVTVQPELLLAAHFGKIGLGFDLGYDWRSLHPPTLPYGDGLTLGPWFSAGLGDKVVLRIEMFAEKYVNTDFVGTGADFPIELLGGLEFRATDSLGLYAGASFGLSDGIGDPDFRIIGGLRYRKTPTGTKDASGKVDDRGHPEDQGFRDSDGDGVLDKDDKAPYEPEDEDGFQDNDGAPEPDNDGDGILDGDDECPELKGDTAHDGCPAHTFVKIEEGRIYIFGKVQFRSGSDEIDKRSEPLLDQIAQALNANPQVSRVEIQGHTDNVGGPALNMRLSGERANAVKIALEKRGVDGGRLQPRGYGESKPIAPNTTNAGRAKNRRVEFVIGR